MELEEGELSDSDIGSSAGDNNLSGELTTSEAQNNHEDGELSSNEGEDEMEVNDLEEFKRDESEPLSDARHSDADLEDLSTRSSEEESEPLWHGSLQYLKLKRTKPFNPEECYDLIENSTVINNELPKSLPVNGMGSIVFLVSAETFKCAKDVGFDFLRPWRGRDEDGKLIVPKVDKDSVGGRWLKTIRATHHSNRHIHKLQRYWMDERGMPTSPVLYQYMFLSDGIQLPQPDFRVFTMPSARNEINEALAHRTTTAAKKYLAEEGVDFNPKTVTKLASSHPTVIKQGSGPRVATDVEKLREMRRKNPNILIHEGKENGEGHDDDLRVICTFPEAISIVLHSCPTAAEITQHRVEISELETLNDEGETEAFLEALVRKKTISQTLPKMGTQAQSDTTFEVCHLLLTIVIGVVDTFVTKNSGKSSSTVMAIMFHPSKDERHHQALGTALEAQMKEIAPHRRIPAYVTDGEVGLQAISKGKAFELTARVGCDIHKKGNLLDKFGRVMGEQYAPVLFGKKFETDSGHIYARGILGMCQESRFKEKVNELQTTLPRLYKWIHARQDDLWKRHSLRSKLNAGFIGQYLTSNIIEQRNQELKLHLKSKCPAEVVLELFLQKDKMEVQKFRDAVAGGWSSVRLAKHAAVHFRSETEWNSLTCLQKKDHLAPFGIEFKDVITEKIVGAVPAWLFKGFSLARKEEFSHSVNKLKVYDMADFFLVKIPNEPKSNVEVGMTSRGLLECTGNCKVNKKVAVCEHIVAVLMSFDVDKRATAIAALAEKEEKKTDKQILASSIHKDDGGKGGRKGGDWSKTNEGRTEKVFTTFDFWAKSRKGKRGAADEGAAGGSNTLPSKRSASSNDGSTDVPPVRSRRDRPVAARSLFTP